MAGTIDGLIKEARDLPEDQRLTLAYRILSTLEPPISAEIEEAWEREISGRIKNSEKANRNQFLLMTFSRNLMMPSSSDA